MMGLALSRRLDWMLQSEIRTMSIECARCGGIDLSQGDSDLEVPSQVREGAKEAIDTGINTYTSFEGRLELREAIAGKQKQFAGLEIDPEKEIVVSCGASGALYCALLAVLNPGDEVIVFEPYYEYHVTALAATQATPVHLRLSPPDWSFNHKALERLRTPRTRALLVNTPANPSGKVFSKSELGIISTFAVENDLFVFADEIYEHFVYDTHVHIPPASLPGMRERTISISGLSKTFSVTGWRIGYCICDQRWTQAIGLFNDFIYACAPAPLQMGVARGLKNLGLEFYAKIGKDYMRRRDKICSALSAGGLRPFIPQGGYFVLADLSPIPGHNSRERALNLLHQAGVACVPGEAFYHDGYGKTLGRFCFAKEDSLLDEACGRIRKLSNR
jgi:aminotransferase